ncbi:MAG: LptF/LptG family permease, partial [Candidatus Sumerlaeia bacterium]|nr:LptF/LptG family permease [Candidatus Sumerlaeia bacterium]
AIAVLLTVGNMARNYELLALLMSGISQVRLAQPLLAMAVTIAVLIFCGNELIVPGCEQRARFFEKAYIEGKGEQILTRTKNIILKGKDTRIYNLKDYNSMLKSMTNPIIVDTTQDGGGIQKILRAERAEFVRDEKDQGIWRFYGLEIQEFDEQAELKKVQTFTQPVELALEDNLDKLLAYRKNPEEMNLWELHNYLSILKQRGEKIGRYATDLHIKLAFPLAAILVMVICFSFASKMQLGNLVINFAQAMVLVVAYYALIAFTRALGHNLVLPAVIAAWSPTIIFALLGVIIFKYNSI